jgi:predicted MFS family arabinose efflux permease
MAGKVLTGLIVQYLSVSPILLSAASMGIIGVCLIGVTFCSTYEHFVIVTVVFSPMLASIDVFCPLIIIEIFGSEKLTDAYGLVVIAKVLSSVWGPPIGGALKDYNGNYNVAFYAAGAFQFIGLFSNILMCLFHFKPCRYHAKYVVADLRNYI